MRFAMRIRRARQRAGLSQQQLADLVGIGRSAVANWEADDGIHPATERLQRVALVTGVNFEWLATGRGQISFDTSQDDTPAADAVMIEDPFEMKLIRAFRAAPRREHARIIAYVEQRGGRRLAVK